MKIALTIEKKFKALAWIVGGVLLTGMLISLVTNHFLIRANRQIYEQSTRAIEAVSGIQRLLNEARNSEILAVSYAAVVNVEKLGQLEQEMTAHRGLLLTKAGEMAVDEQAKAGLRDLVGKYFDATARTFEYARGYVTDEASKNITENSRLHYEQLDGQLTGLMDARVKEAYERNRKAVTAAAMSRLLLVLAAGIAVALIIFLRSFSASIVGPINTMAAFVKRIAGGDLDHTVKIDSRDEIGEMGKALNEMSAYLRDMAATAEEIAEGNLKADVTPKSERDVLGNSFNRMVGGLRKLITEIRQGSERLAAAATQIALSADQTSKNAETSASAVEEMTATMHEMSTTMQSVATNTQKQALSVAETSSSIEQMMGSIQTVAEYARGLLTISQKSRDAVAGGSDAVGKASGGMNEINSVIQKAEQIISSLGGKTEDMARIVEVIDDISEQTNLLALNAAIEAARAGEQGLGFAVVADEVRKLAERSALSTREIAELIQSVAREGKSAVDNMNRSSSMVQHGLRFTKEVIEALEGIRAAVDGLSQYADHIGVATQEQSKGSDQIRKSVAALNDAIHEISSASEQQSLGASQVVQAIERVKDMVHQSASGAVQLASSAEQLNQQAGNLQSLVDKFSLNGHAPAASLVKAA
jgi:methyl-accepting chemotaxis protein